jgi:hypothetical protein
MFANLHLNLKAYFLVAIYFLYIRSQIIWVLYSIEGLYLFEQVYLKGIKIRIFLW